MEDFERMKALSYSIPAQHDPGWFELRFRSANSSGYGDYFNAWGRRGEELHKAASKTRTEPNYYMSFGTTFERTSGYLFTATTGLEYSETGSVGHKSNDRIRGSVDGYGLDKNNKLYILETKTPSKRVPSGGLPSEEYLYQIIQNIEIANASYAYFNDVRLVPCATSDFYHPALGRDPANGTTTECTYARHQFAKRLPSPITMVFLRMYPTEETLKSGKYTHWWVDNIFDAFAGAHEKVTQQDLFRLITELVYKFIPVSHTTNVGDDARCWLECQIDEAREDFGNYCAGYAVMRLDAHLIQKVFRNKTFWETRIKPIAEKWIADLDAVQSGKEVPEEPPIDHSELPWPEDPVGTQASSEEEEGR